MGFRSTGTCTICRGDLPDYEEYTHKSCRDAVTAQNRTYEEAKAYVESVRAKVEAQKQLEKHKLIINWIENTRRVIEGLRDKSIITGATTIDELDTILNQMIREYR